MQVIAIVMRKEIRDHFRDTRALVSTIAYASIGPAAVALVSTLRPAARGAVVLWSMASVFALVSAFAGGMNVALDATAGERERRSLIPLLLTPAARREVVIGKWIAAAVFGLASLAVTAIGCVLVFLTVVDPSRLWEPAPRVAAWLVAGLGPLVLLGSSCHLLIAIRSASTKEAHTWLSSAVYVPMMAGLGLVFAPWLAGPWWPLLPLAGQQVWISRMIEGQTIPVLSGVLLCLVTIAAALPPLWLARRALDRDDLLAG
jgi:sodium transport system permease protein